MEFIERRPALRSHTPPSALDLVGCPECGAPAEVSRRDALGSTDGLIEHVFVRCVDRHWFYMPASMLPAAG